jgi:hypothetical protein
MPRILVALLATIAASWSAAGAATAATVSLHAEPVADTPHGPTRYALSVEGGPEADQLSVVLTAPYGGSAPGPPSEAQVTSSGGGPLTAGAGCSPRPTPGEPVSVSCPVVDPVDSFSADIEGGAGDDDVDVATVSNTTVVVRGGGGDDRLIVHGSADVYGDAGDDWLLGSGAHLFGGAGRDRFFVHGGTPTTDPPAAVTADDDGGTADLVTCGYYAADPPIVLGPSDVSVLCGPVAAHHRTPPEIPAGVTASPVRRTGERAPALQIVAPGRSDNTGQVGPLLVACSDDVARLCDVRVTVRSGA